MSHRNDKLADMNESAWSNPAGYREVVTVQEARSIIIRYQGRILACGHNWEIVPSRVAVGTITLTLRRL